MIEDSCLSICGAKRNRKKGYRKRAGGRQWPAGKRDLLNILFPRSTIHSKINHDDMTMMQTKELVGTVLSMSIALPLAQR